MALSAPESTDSSSAHQCNLQVLDDASDDWVSLMLGNSGFDMGALGSQAGFPLPDLEDFEFADMDCPGLIPSASSTDLPGASFDDILCSFEDENSNRESTQDVPFECKEVLEEGNSGSHDCHPSAWGVDPTSIYSGFSSQPSSTRMPDFCVRGTSPSVVANFSPSPESGLTHGSCEFEDKDINIAIMQGDASGSEEDDLFFLVSDICSEGTGSTEVENGTSSVSMVPEVRNSEVQDVIGDGTLCRQAETDARHTLNAQQQFPCGSDNGVKTTVSAKISRKRKAVDRKSRSSTPEETVVDSIETSKDAMTGDGLNGSGEDGEKRQARLMRNRESAQLSRQRKKIYVDELEEKIKTMASTITELNNTINLISTENINLRRQLGFFSPHPGQPGGIPVTAPWMGAYHGGPVVGGRFMVAGSQVPLVPIPRWRPQQVTVKKTKKSKSETQEKGPEAKTSTKRTKKVAGVALIGLFFFIFTFLPLNLNFLHLKPIAREEVNLWDTHLLNSHSGNILVRTGGRVLTGISKDDNPRQDEPRTRWASLGSSKSENVAEDSPVPEDWQALTDYHRGAQDNREHNGHGYERNGSVPLAATLFVPRNDRLVRVEGNLIIHSILAGDKAAGESINMHQRREELKWKGVRMQEHEDRGQALDANLKALAVKVTTEEKGALVDLRKALAAKSRSDHDEGGIHSVQEDGTLQQWFMEGLAGPVFSSGMCTELFQFETSVARSTPSSATTSHGHEMNDLVENSTIKLHEHGPRKAGRWISSARKDTSYAVPLPPAGHKVTFDGSSKKRNVTGSSERFKPEEEVKDQKYHRSSIVVSVLAGSEFGDPARLPGGLKGRPQIFVVVLVDSVKYVTYSCLLPLEKVDGLQGGYNL